VILIEFSENSITASFREGPRTMPAVSSRSKPKSKSTFNTLAREESFRNPTSKGSTVPILNEFVAPHIESFNALFDDSGLPSGDGDGRGLLSLAIKDIGERVAFDRNGDIASESGVTGWGNRMSSEFNTCSMDDIKKCHSVWIEQVTLARPMVPDKERLVEDRRTYPAEVSNSPITRIFNAIGHPGIRGTYVLMFILLSTIIFAF
jgi:DNA-directed RNA polymerase I subunit RPA2